MTFTVFVDGAEMGTVVGRRLRELCAQHAVDADITTVDVVASPDVAETLNVIGVPTVIREEPPPRRRVVGGLDDDRRVADALGLDATADGAGRRVGRNGGTG